MRDGNCLCFPHQSNHHWSSRQKKQNKKTKPPHRHCQQVTQSTKTRAQLSTRRTYLFPSETPCIFSPHTGAPAGHAEGVLESSFIQGEEGGEKNPPWPHRNTASLAARHCRICLKYQKSSTMSLTKHSDSFRRSLPPDESV